MTLMPSNVERRSALSKPDRVVANPQRWKNSNDAKPSNKKPFLVFQKKSRSSSALVI